MTFFPLPRRMRSFAGPHMTCLQSAESYTRRFSKKKDDHVDEITPHSSFISKHIRFIFYFCSGFLTFAALLASAAMCLVLYGVMLLFLRFQYKFTLLFIMMQRQRIDFYMLNKLSIYCLQILLLFVGGFGWISLLYIEL